MLEQPRYIELLYSPDDRIVGIRKVTEETPHAYMLKGQGSKYRNSFNISGIAFLNHYQIAATESIRRDAYMDGEVLCVRLGDPGTVVTALRKPRAMPGGESDA